MVRPKPDHFFSGNAVMIVALTNAIYVNVVMIVTITCATYSIVLLLSDPATARLCLSPSYS